MVVVYRFTNTALHRIDAFEARVVLPVGQVVTGLDDYLPRPGKDDSGEPYSLTMELERRCLVIKAAGLKTGDRVLLKFRMKSGRRPLWPLVLLVLLSILYLVLCRDLVATPGKEGKTDA
ncbi:MAG: hypothetical protein HY815_31965 [Candidatus Riflebacteria bacterium]|nr:hypothetical protein [Candidatus Riflebacteria bacterium]